MGFYVGLVTLVDYFRRSVNSSRRMNPWIKGFWKWVKIRCCPESSKEFWCSKVGRIFPSDIVMFNKMWYFDLLKFDSKMPSHFTRPVSTLWYTYRVSRWCVDTSTPQPSLISYKMSKNFPIIPSQKKYVPKISTVNIYIYI